MVQIDAVFCLLDECEPTVLSLTYTIGTSS